MDRHPNDLTTDDEIAQAIEAAKAFDDEPRAVSARYVGGVADVVVIQLSTGGRLTIPREELQGLENASEAQLSEIQIWGPGVSLSWPQLDADHYLPHLLEHRYGSDAWMEKLRVRGVAA
jgi:hypothetical protein